MFCTSCGTKIENGAKFCVKCGSKVTYENETTKKFPKRIIIVWGTIVIFIFIMAVIGINLTKSTGVVYDVADYDESINDTKEKTFDITNEELSQSNEIVDNGKARNIEEYYKEHKAEVNSELENLEIQYSDVYSDISYAVRGNTFTYMYTFKEHIDDIDEKKALIDVNLTDEIVRVAIDAIEEETGVDGVSIQYIYCNDDGVEIYNNIFRK